MGHLRADVLRVFPEFSRRWEGDVGWFYVDVLGLVTIGIGCLVDPIHLALDLPMVRRADGSPATKAEIRASWEAVKGAADRLKTRHFRYARDFSTVELPRAGIDELMLRRLAASEAWLVRTFPGLAEAPADAQLGIISMAWAAGPNFTAKFPRFTAAARAGDWWTCADECKLREAGNPGVVPRNLADKWLFTCAALANSPTAEPDHADRVHWEPSVLP
jgi:GH24 family phage-related lysozyme (muramidase)